MLKNPRVKLGIVLWAVGMAGVVAVSFTMIPQLLAKAPQHVSLSVAIGASVLQSGMLLALAVWAGVVLSKPLGLGAPVIEAALSGTGVSEAIKKQILPAVIGGLLIAGLLVYLNSVSPPELRVLSTQFEIPLLPKLLYGGVTEEILMRWGLMSVLVWLPWRIFQKRDGTPRTAYIMSGILISALLFGVGHLPAVAAMGAQLSPSVVTYIVTGNTIPGILFGILYWRRGLEAAMLAHALAHAASSLVL